MNQILPNFQVVQLVQVLQANIVRNRETLPALFEIELVVQKNLQTELHQCIYKVLRKEVLLLSLLAHEHSSEKLLNSNNNGLVECLQSVAP